MSILIKRTDTTSGGVSSKGYPPGNVSNVSISGGSNVVLIRFSDPDDTIEGATILSAWQSTILVRKKGSAPTSIKDGDIVLTNTIRNKYKDSYFTDTNVEFGNYYYRFFICSTDKVYNDSTNMIYSTNVAELDPILKNNTWDQINVAAETGNIPSTWNIGDEIDLTLSGEFNETITLQIWDFNHFDKSDGSGKAGICFGSKDVMNGTQKMNTWDTNSGGWNATYMKNTVMQNIFKSMPSNLQNYIKEVNTYANKGNNGTDVSSSPGLLSTDKVFLPGNNEVCNTYWSQSTTEKNQTQFPIFTDDSSRKKTMHNEDNVIYSWWTRSPYYYDTTYCFCYIDSSGTYYNYKIASADLWICFCFCI